MLKKFLKISARIIACLMFILLFAVGLVYAISSYRTGKKYMYATELLPVPQDSLSIEKGRHLYQVRSCQDCHGINGGGSVFMNDKILLQLSAPNITKGVGGVAPDFGVNDWLRVLRHGVDRNGKSLYMMPSQEVAQLSNEDMANLIAYCQQLDPVDSIQPNLRSIGLVGRVLLVLGKVPMLPAEHIDHAAQYQDKTDETNQSVFGKYLSTSCQGCHRPDMKGGSPLAPGFPPVPDISASGKPGMWNSAEFKKAIRSGITPDGRQLNNTYMPWKSMNAYTDYELESILTYLKNIP